MSGWRKALPFAPSVLIGVLGAAWIAVRNLGWLDIFMPDRGLATVAAASVLLLCAILGSAWALEKVLPSFRYAGNLMERVLRRLDLGSGAIFAFATLTSVSEELFFRGALLQEFGLWPQAVVFGLLHPATRKGWSYPVFAFATALALGWLTLSTGTLWAPIAVHFAINLFGLWQASRSTARRSPG